MTEGTYSLEYLGLNLPGLLIHQGKPKERGEHPTHEPPLDPQPWRHTVCQYWAPSSECGAWEGPRYLPPSEGSGTTMMDQHQTSHCTNARNHLPGLVSWV
eukprot:2836921-Rhodomonas_salina.8